jgi:hypothetical protein
MDPPTKLTDAESISLLIEHPPIRTNEGNIYLGDKLTTLDALERLEQAMNQQGFRENSDNEERDYHLRSASINPPLNLVFILTQSGLKRLLAIVKEQHETLEVTAAAVGASASLDIDLDTLTQESFKTAATSRPTEVKLKLNPDMDLSGLSLAPK